ncbi:hypothetical protein ACN2XU_15810 [Primorskyibacter sp. 2E107]|uniref:hypothetical protein n=1 Tax=Primorskyibacter sp. 2E107 TaxID=3403458 RepID=UPI003AF4B80D
MKSAYALTAILALTAGMAQAGEPNPALQGFLNNEIRAWAASPVLIDAVVAQNNVTADYDETHVLELDQQWRAEVGAAASPTIDAVLNNAASTFLREQVIASGGAITEVFLMDAHGLNVASSGVTSDYWQGDEAKFQETYSVGPEAVHFSEIEFDESSQSFQAQISMTLTDSSGAVIGAMTVGVNADMLM